MIKNIFNRILHKMAFLMPGGTTLRPMLHRLRGTKIGNNVWISQMVYLDELHPEAVTIGNYCTIGVRTSIFTHFYWGPRQADYNEGKVLIEDNVFIGPHCVILPGVKIGEGSVIKAGSVVTRDVPAHAFWGPPPAGLLGRVTVPLTKEHDYEDFVRGLKPARRKPAVK